MILAIKKLSLSQFQLYNEFYVHCVYEETKLHLPQYHNFILLDSAYYLYNILYVLYISSYIYYIFFFPEKYINNF